MIRAGSIMRAFLNSLRNAEDIAFQFETESKKITLNVVSKESLSDLIEAAELLETSGAWNNIALYEENDAIYAAFVRLQKTENSKASSMEDSEYDAVTAESKPGDIKLLQQELKKLGYYLSSVDGRYDAQTQEAIELFQAANGLPVTGSADANTLWLLYETDAEPYQEPENVLFVDRNVRPRIENITNKRAKVSFQVTSIARLKQVKAFELYVYALDVWGQPVGERLSISTTRNIKPAESVRSSIIILENSNKVASVHCAIHKVAYEDGTVYTVPESQIQYVSWDVR